MSDKLEEKIVPLGKCPEGLFWFDGTLGFKSEYRSECRHPELPFQTDAYVVESGEYFWGGTSDPIERERLLVQPIAPALAASRLAERGEQITSKFVVRDVDGAAISVSEPEAHAPANAFLRVCTMSNNYPREVQLQRAKTIAAALAAKEADGGE